MAKYGIVGTAPRIIVLILALAALVFSGFIWFDFLGLIDVKDTFAPVLGLVGIKSGTAIEGTDAPDLLDQQRLAQQWEALELRMEEQNKREESLDFREAELIQMMEKVLEQENALEEKEKSLSARLKQYENKNANLRKVSEQFVNMPPAEAVDRLVEMSDQDVIDILRMTDVVAAETGANSVASYWLQLMPADRSARIQEKMIDKPS
ncbi:MAG: flagellar protein FlbB [Spirochaetales bacterium]|jgi:flagellar protein FlbB|nr:flagellar protein FlbB [Spirochaetales bacterium]